MLLTQSCETIVANLTGCPRRERVGRREFIVAPLTMIVPGVLNGSCGPILYPREEVEASAPYWEGVILTDGHLPRGTNGRHVRTHDQYAMGYVQNPTIQNGRLKGEGWFDVDRTRRISPLILRALERGERIELSTGLNVDFDHTPGIHNGRPYDSISRRYRPDHLAVLVAQRGACSIQDGCGVNNDATHQHDIGCFCRCCTEKVNRLLDEISASRQRQTVGNHEPLGIPEIDWSQGNTTQQPAIQRYGYGISQSGGPAGGSLGHTEIVWERQPVHQQPQQQFAHVDQRIGPAGGSLGPSPSLF